jgi:rhodanese-related sulfurtransferase
MKTRSWMLIFGAMLLVLGLAACSDDDDGGTGPGPSVNEFEEVADVGDAYFGAYTRPDGGPINISAADVYDAILNGKADTYFIVDWRSSTHYANGHIQGAINMALPNIIDELNVFPTDKVILNVCYSGQTASTATAILNMLGTAMGDNGYNAANLVFGMHGWTYQGNTDLLSGTATYPMENDWDEVLETTVNAKPAAGSYPTIDTGKSKAFDILKERANLYVKGELNTRGSGWNNISDDGMWDELFVNMTGDDWFVVNYFPPANYEAGHIPGAYQYTPKADLSSDTFLNTLPTDKKILVYCWTGQTSAQVTVYLNMLGYEAYSLLYGVQDMCYDRTAVNTHAFTPITDPEDAYPVVTD